MSWWGFWAWEKRKIAEPITKNEYGIGKGCNVYRIVNEAGELIDVQYLPEEMPWTTFEERQPVRQNEYGQETWIRQKDDAVKIKCYCSYCLFTFQTEYCHANPVIDRIGRCLSFQIISGDYAK